MLVKNWRFSGQLSRPCHQHGSFGIRSWQTLVLEWATAAADLGAGVIQVGVPIHRLCLENAVCTLATNSAALNTYVCHSRRYSGQVGLQLCERAGADSCPATCIVVSQRLFLVWGKLMQLSSEITAGIYQNCEAASSIPFLFVFLVVECLGAKTLKG